MAHGFNELSLASIYAWIMEGNEPSRTVLEKNGFLEAGKLRKASRSGEYQVDRIIFDRVNPAFGGELLEKQTGPKQT